MKRPATRHKKTSHKASRARSKPIPQSFTSTAIAFLIVLGVFLLAQLLTHQKPSAFLETPAAFAQSSGPTGSGVAITLNK